MTATYQTKREILQLFQNGRPLTLTDISAQLGLAASTVSQHLTELRTMGAIQEVDRQGTKKWKYYKLSEEHSGDMLVKWSDMKSTRNIQVDVSREARDKWTVYSDKGRVNPILLAQRIYSKSSVNKQ
jgi:DNA-binding transcriptional ArsR family regulator